MIFRGGASDCGNVVACCGEPWTTSHSEHPTASPSQYESLAASTTAAWGEFVSAYQAEFHRAWPFTLKSMEVVPAQLPLQALEAATHTLCTGLEGTANCRNAHAAWVEACFEI